MDLNSIAERLWAIELKSDPVAASLKGFHEYDDLLQDLSAEALGQYVSDLRSVQADAEALDDQSLDRQELITRDLAVYLARVNAGMTETGYLHGAVDTYTGAATSLLLAVASLAATSESETRSYIDRWRQVPRLLEQTLELNLIEAEKGRAPAVIVVERVIDMIDGYLGTPIERDGFVKASLHPGADDSLRLAAVQVAEKVIRPAYQTYRDALAERVVPRARPEERPGLAYTSDGDAIYRQLIGMYTSLEAASPKELHAFGLSEATDKLPHEWAEVGRRALGISDLSRLFDRLRNDEDLSYRNADEMTAHARETLERAWAAIDGWFGSRPQSSCDVVEVPSEIAKDLPPAFYLTPSSDGSRPGRYFLNTHDPTSRKRFNYESIHFHEAIPGHHFDRSLSMELTGIPEFRKRFPSFAMAEGWGLYAERLGDEMGLYSSDMDRLGMLAADAWRAGRLVVDTGMHHLGWSRKHAIQWMLQWTPIPLPVIEQEIDRYIGMPGQALAYKTGQRAILGLRAKAERRLGPDFSIAEFHDAVLTHGGLTLPILEDVVDDWLIEAEA